MEQHGPGRERVEKTLAAREGMLIAAEPLGVPLMRLIPSGEPNSKNRIMPECNQRLLSKAVRPFFTLQPSFSSVFRDLGDGQEKDVPPILLQREMKECVPFSFTSR